MTAVSLHALGVRVEVRFSGVDAGALARAVETAWSRCLPTGLRQDAAPLVVLSAGVGLEPAPDVVTGDELDEVMEGLTQRITVDALTRQAGRLLMLHACALAHPVTGEAALLVGPSGVGKTTLAATLGRRWAYLSDETAAITGGGDVLAYPKPLSIVRTGRAKQQRSPDELGLRTTTQPARPRGILLLDRRSGVEAVGLEALPMGEAVCLLAEHTSFLTMLEAPLHRVSDLVDEAGGAHRVVYGEADQLPSVIAAAIGDVA